MYSTCIFKYPGYIWISEYIEMYSTCILKYPGYIWISEYIEKYSTWILKYTGYISGYLDILKSIVPGY